MIEGFSELLLNEIQEFLSVDYMLFTDSGMQRRLRAVIFQTASSHNPCQAFFRTVLTLYASIAARLLVRSSFRLRLSVGHPTYSGSSSRWPARRVGVVLLVTSVFRQIF